MTTALRQSSLASDVRDFVDLRDEIAADEKAVKEKQARLDELESNITEQYGMDGVNSIRLDGGPLVYKTVEIYASVKKDNRRAMLLACEANGLGDLVETNVATGRLKSWIKETIGDERDYSRVPPGIFVLAGIFEKVKLRVRKF